EGAIDGAPRVARRPVDRDRSAATVEGPVAEVEVVFQADEGRQDLPTRPAGAALLGPEVEVFEHAADGDLAVDRGAAAHTAPAPVEARFLGGRAAGHQGVVAETAVLWVVDDVERVGNLHGYRRVRRAVVGAGLEQEDGRIGIFGEAGGERGTA